MIEMKLRQEYFDKIKNGEKIYEIRLNDEKRQNLKINDRILFKNLSSDEFIETKIEELLYFKTFKEMLSFLPLQRVGFVNLSINQIENIYYEFYKKTDEEKYGVVAIKIKLI